MKLKELCRAAGIECPTEAANELIEQIVTDSQKTAEGTLFVCIRGLHTDGHTYITDAVKNGCRCIVVEEDAVFPCFPDVHYLIAKSTRRAAARLYHAWYGFPTEHMKMIGVTGTNGKTSVTYLLRAILQAAGHRCGLIGTVGCESVGRQIALNLSNRLANMTTPDPEALYAALARMKRDSVEYVLMEVSSHALSMGRVDPIRFDTAIFTNLSPEHLDFHQTMEDYADAKAQLFENSKLSIINLDSPYAERMMHASAGTVITCSQKQHADYAACVAEPPTMKGVSYDLRRHGARLRIDCPIPCEFSVMNSMQAAVAALEFGIDPEIVQKTLRDFSGVRGRMEHVALDPEADFSVWIDYAHTPDALEKLLQSVSVRKREGGRIVLLFGCGGDRDRTKRPEMGKIASTYADFVIVTSDNSRGEDPHSIIEEILAGMDSDTPRCVIVDRAEAIGFAVRSAKPKDVILLAGKGHEEYEIRRDERIPFCEKELVQAAYAKRIEQRTNKKEKESDS